MTNAWMIKPYPRDKDGMSDFLRDSNDGIGYVRIGDLSGLSRNEIKIRLKEPPYSYIGTNLSSYGPLDVIVNQIVIGDIIVCPHKDKIHFGVVTGDYTYESTMDIDIGGYPHLRNVDWKVAISKNNLPSSLVNAIKVLEG